MNRRLIELIREVKVDSHDCGTDKVLLLDVGEFGYEHVYGRILAADFTVGEVTYLRNTIVDKSIMENMVKNKSGMIPVRSPIFCKAKSLCSMCYGYDFHTMRPAKLGEMVGILAAQAISEPITQMLMDSKHYRDVSTSVDFTVIEQQVATSGILYLSSNLLCGDLNLDAEATFKVGEEIFSLPYGARLKLKEGDLCQAHQVV